MGIRTDRREQGITIVEMMIVVAIVAVLAAIAAPNLSGFFIQNRLDTGVNEFITALNLARSEAMRRGANVVIVRKTGGATAWDWTPGWAIREEGSGEVIRESQTVVAPMTLYSAQVTELGLRFTAGGRASNVTNFRVFILCHGSAPATTGGQSRSRAVIVTNSGRIQLAATNEAGQPLKPPASESTPGQVAVTSCTTP